MNDDVVELQIQFDVAKHNMWEFEKNLKDVISNIANALGKDFSQPLEDSLKRVTQTLKLYGDTLNNPLTTAAKKFSLLKHISGDFIQDVLDMQDSINRLPVGTLRNDAQKIQNYIEGAANHLHDLAHSDNFKRVDVGLKHIEDSAETVEEFIESLRRETHELDKNSESTAKNTREKIENKNSARKSIEEMKKFLESNKQERWNDDEVIKFRTQLIKEQMEELEGIVSSETNIAHTEENLNAILERNTQLIKERNSREYSRLKLVERIKSLDAKRYDTGDSATKLELSKLKETERALRSKVQAYDAQIKENRILANEIKNTLKLEKETTREDEKQSDAEKQKAEELKSQIRLHQEDIKQAKASTSQYYYRLRSMKMLNRYLQMANKAMNNFGKKALSSFARLGKSITGVTKKFRLFHLNVNKASKSLKNHTKIVKSTTRAHDSWGKSLKRSLTTVLKYTLGIRSLYILFNRLRGAASEGMQVMATQYSSVNQTMSSIVTSLNQMKNALTTIVQPIMVLIAPVLARLAEMLSNVTVKIASFIAAFTGQKTVFKAIRVNKDYIDSLKKQKKALKDLNKEQLAHYDMLNVIDEKKEEDETDDISDLIGFEEIPIEADSAIVDFVNKIKDLIKQLLQPIIDAWNKWKDEIKKALARLWDSIKRFLKHLIDAILKVWSESKTREIFEKLFEALRNIIEFVRIIIDKIDEAFMHLQNGERIIRAIRDIIWIIAEWIRRCTAYAVEWAKSLNLVPLFDAIREALEEHVVPAMQKVADLAFTLFQAFLEIVKYLLERFGPTVAEIWGLCWDVIGNIAEALNNVLSNGDDIFDENDRIYRILQSLEDIVDIILDGIKRCVEATVEWSKHLEKPLLVLFDRIEQVLEKLIKPAIQDIVDLLVYLYTDVLLTIAYWMIGTLLPNLVEIFGWLVGAIGNIAKGIRKALEEGDRGNEIAWNLIGIFNAIIDKLKELAQYTYEWAEQLDFAPYFESLKNLLQDIMPMLNAVLDIIGAIYTEVILEFVKYLIEEGLPKLNEMIGEFVDKVDWDHLTAKVKEFLEAFGKFLEKAWETFVIILGDLGDAFAKFVNSESFDHLVDTLIKWMNEADPDKMAKGIEQLVTKFIALKVALSFGTILGSFKEMVMTLINFGNNKALARNITKNTDAINKLKKALPGVAAGAKEATEELEGLDPIDEMIRANAEATETSARGLLGVLSKFGGVVAIAGGGLLSFAGFLDGVQNGFSLSELAATGLGDALIGLGLVALGVVSGPIGAAVAAGLFIFQQLFIGIHQRMEEFGETFPEAWDNFWGGIGEKLKEIFGNLGHILGEAVGKLVGSIWQYIKDTIASYDGNWLELGKDIILGIIKIFTLPFKIFQIIVEAVASLVQSFIEGLRDGFDTHSPSKLPEIVQIGVDILGGIFNGMVEAMLGFPLWLWNNIIVPIKDAFVEKAKEIWGDLKEAGAGFIENLKQGAESKYNDIKESISGLWGDIKEGVSTWWSGITQDISDWWEGIKSTASEKYEDIRSTIETKWSEAKENVNTWWGDISGDLSTWWEGIQSDASTKFEDVRSEIEGKWNEAKENASTLWGEITDNLKDAWEGIKSDASDKFEDIRSNIENKWLELKENIQHIWQDISSDLRGWWSDLLGDARGKFEDIKEGIADKWENVKSNTSEVWDNVKETVGDKVEAIKDHKDKMEDVGHNLIDGLKEGLENRMHSALDTVRDIAGQIADAARNAFDIHSPSKVFAEIGQMITAGLVEGIDEDSDDAKDAMYNLVPGLEAFDRLYDIIVSKLSTLRQDAVLIVDSMIDEISASISRLDNLDVLGSTISKLNNIDIPDIAAGKVVSPQIEMLINKDNSKLEKLLEDILDKLDELPDNPGDNNSNNPNVVLQLDRTVLAEAVWDETEKRYKQTGRRPVFA